MYGSLKALLKVLEKIVVYKRFTKLCITAKKKKYPNSRLDNVVSRAPQKLSRRFVGLKKKSHAIKNNNKPKLRRYLCTNCKDTFFLPYDDHLELRKVTPKFIITRRCFESLSRNNLFRYKNEGGNVLNLIQLK